MQEGFVMEENTGKKKRKRKGIKIIGWFSGTTLIIAALAIVYTMFKNGAMGDILNFFKSKDNINPDDLSAISDTIPLDHNGVISITYPFVDRTLNEPAGLYSLPEGYEPYFIYNSEANQAVLSQVKDSDKMQDNVINYESNNGTNPDGYVGVKDDYATFLTKAAEVKRQVLAGEGNYTTKLVEIDYEVPNLYYLKAGYELYCTDASISKDAKLAYVLEDGSKIYMIPQLVIDKFIAVEEKAFELIDKYDTLNEQIVDVYYQVYEKNGVSDELNTEAHIGR